MDGVLGEARYFGIQSIVDQIEKLKLAEEKKKSDVPNHDAANILDQISRKIDNFSHMVYRNIRK